MNRELGGLSTGRLLIVRRELGRTWEVELLEVRQLARPIFSAAAKSWKPGSRLGGGFGGLSTEAFAVERIIDVAVRGHRRLHRGELFMLNSLIRVGRHGCGKWKSFDKMKARVAVRWFHEGCWS